MTRRTVATTAAVGLAAAIIVGVLAVALEPWTSDLMLDVLAAVARWLS